VKLKDGVTFLGARPCNPMLWMISQDARVEGHRVVTLHCRKKESSYAQRSVMCLHTESPEFRMFLCGLDYEVRNSVSRRHALKSSENVIELRETSIHANAGFKCSSCQVESIRTAGRKRNPLKHPQASDANEQDLERR
ncbi:transmembrane protein 132C isoform X1, partial [Tachysurus ichikawai]